MRSYSHSRLFALIPTIVASTMATTPTVASEMNSKFGRIAFGQSREVVLTLMGPPTSVKESSFLGLTTSRLRWQETVRAPAFVVVLLAGRVIVTASCDPASDC